MKIAELDPDPRASTSLSGGPLPSQKHGRRWDGVSPLATELAGALEKSPVAPHLPSQHAHLSLKDGVQGHPRKEALHSLQSCVLSGCDIPCCPGRPAGPMGPGNGVGEEKVLSHL